MQELLSHESAYADSRPLPLIVAEKWGFKLAHVIEDGAYWYSPFDWIDGLLEGDSKSATEVWSKIRKQGLVDTLLSNQGTRYIRRDGREFEVRFITDKGLYLIAQHLRATKTRFLLREIREYLANAGAFVDLVRREPYVLMQAINPDKMLDAVIAEYRRRGKDDEWITARITGKIKRAMFTTALRYVIIDLSEKHFGLATNEVYCGLWGRNAEQLKAEIGLGKYASLRDNQPSLALSYQGIAEEACAKKLGWREELTWDEARQIIREAVGIVAQQAQIMSDYLEVDLATGQPLLADKI